MARFNSGAMSGLGGKGGIGLGKTFKRHKYVLRRFRYLVIID